MKKTLAALLLATPAFGQDVVVQEEIIFDVAGCVRLPTIRKGDYKYVFSEQRKPGTMGLWAEPFTTLRLHKVFNLFQDPYERADITSNTFWDWQLNHIGSMYGVMDDVFKFAETFDEFPPRSYPPSFNPANIMEHKLRMIQVEQELRKAFPILPEPVKPEPKN